MYYKRKLNDNSTTRQIDYRYSRYDYGNSNVNATSGIRGSNELLYDTK